MMASLIGGHFRSNGLKQGPFRAVLSLNGVGLGGDETHPDTITIVRDTRVFPDGEAPPDWRTYDGSDWPAFGEYWYAIHDEYWKLNPADFYQITNEQGGGEGPDVAGNYEQLVKVERAIMQAANADGRKCCIMNLAGGSPGDFELWKEICAPFIVEAWESGGNIYGRHCYADWFVEDDGRINNGQPQRVIAELEHLRSIGYGGGMVLTECGLYGGYGVADYAYFEQQVTRWEQVLRPYADIFIGLAWWEMGSSPPFSADYTPHIKQLLPYIEAGDLPRWTPPEQPPDNGENNMTEEVIQSDNLEFPRIEELRQQVNNVRVVVQSRIDGSWANNDHVINIPIEAKPGIERRVVVQRLRDKPVNPKPPPVVLTLPQGARGVDVSYWQGSFNWTDSGAEFGIIRCSDGMTANTTTHDGNGIDRQFFANAAKLTALGIPWAIYHFLRPGSIQAQADKVKAALNVLAADGMPPVTAVFDNGVELPAVWIDVEDGALTNAHVRDFYDELATVYHTGIYTGKPIWESITAGAAVWWADVPLWIAAYGVNDGTVPPWPDGPFLPRGYVEAILWQYSSNPIDQNIVGPYPPTAVQPPPPTLPPPTGESYSTSFMKAVPNAWRVIRRFDGSGEDVWDLPLGGNRFVRVKNTVWGEWYNGNMRERDTSPAPQSDGTERLYLLNGGAGGQIAPNTAVVGVTYSYTNQVQFKAKQGCADLAENSSETAVSTFLLKEVIDNYTFPSTGFTVDRLFWTVQTGENQLYAIKDGVNIGWVGGGAQQENNVWGGELNELYFDRSIPQQEPPKYCE